MRKGIGQKGALRRMGLVPHAKSLREKEAAQARTGDHQEENVCHHGMKRKILVGGGQFQGRGFLLEKEKKIGEHQGHKVSFDVRFAIN